MTVVVAVSWCIAAAAIVLGAGSLVMLRQPLLSLRVMIELFTAAGLLRLSVDASWAAIAGVAALIAVRRVVTRTLTADLMARTRVHRAGA